MGVKSSIYKGMVTHKRLRPGKHMLKYNVFSLLLDLDELEALNKYFPLFSCNKWSLLSFYERDHGSTAKEPLRLWVERTLTAAEIEYEELKIKLLCYPRVFGYGFNPLSVYFCYDKDEKLICILYEVCNTFRERHTYIIPVRNRADGIIRQNCRKKLYVSPFIAMEAEYNFHITPPANTIKIVIKETDEDGLFLIASFNGYHVNITGLSLLKCLFQYPLMSFKIIGGIHWEAFKLWSKGVPFFKHKTADYRVSVSNVTSNTKEKTP
tara:strand:- start:2252 stop:3049 length:798 start_codon:yes stop_codon:yes gene_type:complete